MTSLLAQMPSTYLKKEDFPQPTRVQIAQFKRETIGKGSEEELVLVVYFHGYDQGMVVNKTNANRLVAIFGDDMEAMIGKSVAVHNDPNVDFGGKQVGGLRFMIETAPPPPMAQPAPMPQGNQPMAPQSEPWNSENPAG